MVLEKQADRSAVHWIRGVEVGAGAGAAGVGKVVSSNLRKVPGGDALGYCNTEGALEDVSDTQFPEKSKILSHARCPNNRLRGTIPIKSGPRETYQQLQIIHIPIFDLILPHIQVLIEGPSSSKHKQIRPVELQHRRSHRGAGNWIGAGPSSFRRREGQQMR